MTVESPKTTRTVPVQQQRFIFSRVFLFFKNVFDSTIEGNNNNHTAVVYRQAYSVCVRTYNI